MGPVYASWAKRYTKPALDSRILSASALGTTLIIIDSYDIAVELLDVRAAKYSSRPKSIMAGELMGWDWVLPLVPYCDAWRAQRKLIVKYFRPDLEELYKPNPRSYEFVHRLLLGLQEAPNEFHQLVRHMAGGLSLSLAYGLPIQPKHDPLVEMVDSLVIILPEHAIPGKWFVEVLPALKYVPSWFPGARFKRFAKSVQWVATKFKMDPYEKAIRSFGTPGVQASFVSNALAAVEAEELTEGERHKEVEAIQNAAATIFVTAADTTSAAIQTLIFALATRPEIRHKIQSELDSVLVDRRTQSLRLPTFEDEEHLPYLKAVVMESQRWAPAAPIGVPHLTTEDDIFDGYFVPKGSVIIANQWSMLNDEKVYGPDAHEFNPDRFLRRKPVEESTSSGSRIELDPTVRHPETIAFGFGRRICPGADLAQAIIWLTASCMLTAFDFEAPPSEHVSCINEDGKVHKKFDPGLLSYPRKFDCEFKIRSAEAAAMLEELGMSV
ncbi:hypothetical protein NMY22_g18812 [Coprinellus aureogranulatus]|nr:hypothetical protein NMY22_g18812 [Coprinellus aureogranulatus]